MSAAEAAETPGSNVPSRSSTGWSRRVRADRGRNRRDVVLPGRRWSSGWRSSTASRWPCPTALVREVSELLARRITTRPISGSRSTRRSWRGCWRPGSGSSPSGMSPALRAMELANDDATMEMEHRTTYLATVGTLGPMIGLVGTVYGMILSFRVIATAGLVAAGERTGRGDLDGAVRHAGRDRDVDPGDLFLRGLSQPDRPALARSGDGGRVAPGTVRARRPGTSHPLAAAAVPQGRSALPPGGQPSGACNAPLRIRLKHGALPAPDGMMAPCRCAVVIEAGVTPART